MRPRVLFSDIDGTLIDIFTREYGNSKQLIRKMKEFSIPVVLCSSKTWAEQEIIRKDLGIECEPFIVENGGAVVIPNGYFSLSDRDLRQHKNIRIVDGYMAIELGKPSSEIRKVLQEIRRKTGIVFEGVSNVSIEQLAKIVGMTYEEAERMSRREYGETILQMDKFDKLRFEQLLNQQGLQVIHGGRYFDVTAGNDKGKAVMLLTDLYRKKLGDDAMFIGIGDSANDIPMLKATDVAILVQKYDGSWTDLGNDVPDILKVKGIGPAGWENAIVNMIIGKVEVDGA